MEEQFDTFDFLVNDEDEVMLLLYEREGEPVSSPRIEFVLDEKSAFLYRNDDDILELNDIDDSILDSLQEEDKLLICELSRDTDENGDNAIVRAYEADIDL